MCKMCKMCTPGWFRRRAFHLTLTITSRMSVFLPQFFVVLRVLRKPPPPIDADVPGNKRLKGATEATALRRKAKQKSKKLTKNEIMESKVAPGGWVVLVGLGARFVGDQVTMGARLVAPHSALPSLSTCTTPAPCHAMPMCDVVQISSCLCRCATSGPTRSSNSSPIHPKRRSRRSSRHRRSVRRRASPSSAVRPMRTGASLEPAALAGRAPWGV